VLRESKMDVRANARARVSFSATHRVLEDERRLEGGGTYLTRLRSVVRLPTRSQCCFPPQSAGNGLPSGAMASSP